MTIFINQKKAFTLVELLISLTVLSIVGLTIGRAYLISTEVIQSNQNQVYLKSALTQAMSLAIKHVRQAKTIDALTESSLTFTADLGRGDESFRLYLYNADDVEPNPPYTSGTYQLRFAKNIVTYGSGSILVDNIQQPSSAAFSLTNNLVTFDWIAGDSNNQYHLRSSVRVRNL